MRRGFTTGSCAAAAATAAAQMLMMGEIVEMVQIQTPGGPVYNAQILDAEILEKAWPSGRTRTSCRCAVLKDGGDDPDITTGTRIVAEVSRSDEPGITIDGGAGIGRVTRPGLDQPVGNAAINRVPRQMIAENVGKILREWQNMRNAPKGLHVVISAPDGETIAEKTFNPKLGIVGGISILGTTGIVEPMSDRAIVETIRAQMRVQKAQGRRYVIAAPGNYGLAFLQEQYGLERNGKENAREAAETTVVQISNFVGEAVEMAADLGFEGFLLAGHIGKLVKVAGGAPNTHSKYGDRRMETLWEMAAVFCPEEDRESLRKEILECVMTDAALEVLDSHGLKEKTAQEMARRICANLVQWSGGRLRAETIVFSHQNRELVRSQGAEEMIRACMER
ncbi:MAG: cobalamin biosynthesis protein CbiD [Lachnospiraceae bacterium]|nr:cobalamin biosynthesis protein CbiD [Lachnospiraceae bacterium]